MTIMPLTIRSAHATALVLLATAVGACTGLRNDEPSNSAADSLAPSPDAGSVAQPSAGTGAILRPVQGAPDSGAAGTDAVPALGSIDLPLELSVTVGAFVLQMHAARIEPMQQSEQPGKTIVKPFSSVEIDFSAHNAATVVETPLGDLDDGVLLEVASKFYFGTVDADPVPGLRDGVGKVSWEIDDVVSIEDLRSAIATFGEADQNKVVIRFADPSTAVTLSDVQIDGPFAITGYRSTTLDFTTVRVQYNSRSSNAPLKTGTAYFVLEGTISAASGLSQYGEYWGEEHVFLERPDGVSVAPIRLNTDIRPGEREDLTLMFDIDQPVGGVYTFGVTAPDLPMAMHEIAVP